MMRRCYSPISGNFKHYGGRGIKVCDAWREDFWTFYADMGPRPTPKHQLDRIDPNGDYDPRNCRWATTKTQGRNRRNSYRIEYNGVILASDEWASILGVDGATITQRKMRGWDDRRIIETPVRASTQREPGARAKSPHMGKGLISALMKGDAA